MLTDFNLQSFLISLGSFAGCRQEIWSKVKLHVNALPKRATKSFTLCTQRPCPWSYLTISPSRNVSLSWALTTIRIQMASAVALLQECAATSTWWTSKKFLNALKKLIIYHSKFLLMRKPDMLRVIPRRPLRLWLIKNTRVPQSKIDIEKRWTYDRQHHHHITILSRWQFLQFILSKTLKISLINY